MSAPETGTPFSGRVVIPAETLVRVVDGESVILSLRNEAYFGLDDIGTAFWTHLAAAPSIEAACERLAREYDAPAETIRKDMREFVEALRQRGLIDVAG